MGGRIDRNQPRATLIVSFALVSSALLSISVQILLPVAPALVEHNGPHGTGGAATAVFFCASVAGESVAPWLMSRRKASYLLVGSQLLVAIPGLIYALPHPDTWGLLVATAARGLGTGLGIVVGLSIVSEFTQPGAPGKSIGYFGLTIGAPAVVFPSFGLFLFANGHADVAAFVAFTSGLGGALFALSLRKHELVGVALATNLVAAFRRRILLPPFLGLILASGTFGGVITYVPIALPREGLSSSATFLLIAGVARLISRWIMGVFAPPSASRLMNVGGVVLVGCGLTALAIGGNQELLAIAAATSGLGYGAVQTGSYIAMIHHSSNSGGPIISAFWNIALDVGSSIGGGMIGILAALYGYSFAVWLLPTLAFLCVPLFRRSRPPPTRIRL